MSRLIILVTFCLLVSACLATYNRNRGQQGNQRDGQSGRRNGNGQRQNHRNRYYKPRCGGEMGNKCLCGEAECVGSDCICKAPYTWGNGAFNCYKDDTLAAELKNDPTLTTYSKENVLFPYPCRYLMTHVRQQMRDKNDQNIGDCEFKIHAFNAKRYGKFFVLGFDVATRLTYWSGRTVEMSSRNYGYLQNNQPVIRTEGTMGEFSPDGPWGQDTISYSDTNNGVRVRLYADLRNMRLYYEVENCGLKILFVPYDVVARQQQRGIPGMSIALKKELTMAWYSMSDSMALSPAWGDLGLLEGHRLPDLTDEQSMVVRAFKTDVEQNHPGAATEECQAVAPVLKTCSEPESKEALDSCYWMLEMPRFIRCYDKSFNSEKILKLFAQCVSVWCDNGSCQDVQKAIRDAGCDSVPRIPEIPKYMAGELCPQITR